MQLDRTQVAIRERGTLEICDLAMHVMRGFSPQLIVVALVGIVPIACINWLLLRWMVEDPIPSNFIRYNWNMALLVFVTAPLATAAATQFLGDAMFMEQPTLKSVLKSLWSMKGRLFFCQAVMRGVLPAWFLVATLSADEPAPGDFLLPMLAMCLFFVRGLRPYLNEIILLERNPLRSRNPLVITIGRRSSNLHNPNGGELMARYMAIGLTTVLVTFMVLSSMWFLVGTVMGDWSWGPVMIGLVLPGAMWTVAGYMAVVRFLAYLDLRARREGWAVELQLRAEANRLAKQAF